MKYTVDILEMNSCKDVSSFGVLLETREYSWHWLGLDWDSPFLVDILFGSLRYWLFSSGGGATAPESFVQYRSKEDTSRS